jgi:enolase
MSFRVTQLVIRTILNSCGKYGVEVEICINDKFKGIGSGPSAIKAGRREKQTSDFSLSNQTDFRENIIAQILNKSFKDQAEFDLHIDELDKELDLGSGLTLSLSIAFCKACALAFNKPLFLYISSINQSKIRIPYPMANVFSGGIHSLNKDMPFQQLMIIPKHDTFAENLDAIIKIYSSLENKLEARGDLLSYSSSSGMLTKGHSIEELFQLINSEIENLSLIDKVHLGIDAAAEHLYVSENTYRYGKDFSIDKVDLRKKYCHFIENDNVFYVEDPFDSSDYGAWESFTKESQGKALIVGDDLFATNKENIKKGLATGILLKMNQIGSITGTIEAAQKADSMGITLCVSHRSCETEDTTMCDLAVGLGASYIKIGGPRRGDRICKYNQLLRIDEARKSKLNL